MMVRLRKTEAFNVLNAELAAVGHNFEGGRDTASSFKVRDGARPGALRLDWWHANTPDNERSDTLRNLAYLRAYHRIGGERMYAGGLFLDRQRLWMDRSVMSRLERDGMILFNGADTKEPWFELTDVGRAWTAKDGAR